MVEALQRGHELGELLRLNQTFYRTFYHSAPRAVPQHSACLVRASQWEAQSR